MGRVTVSSKGQITIPKRVRDALNLSQGTKLNLEVRGHRIVLSKDPAWKRLAGAGAGLGLLEAYIADKQEDRERENSRS
jgi:AbrB family looped-hinge helix DNA binding protein